MSAPAPVQHLSCPVVVGGAGGPGGPSLPMYWYEVDVEIHASVAFVSLRASYLNTTGAAFQGILQVPTFAGRATVCTCDVTFAGRTYSTSVVDPDEHKFGKNDDLAKATGGKGSDLATFDPNVFSMPFIGCPPNQEIIIELKYIQTMEFDGVTGDFYITLPTAVPPSMLYRHLDEVLSISCLINPGTATQCRWQCTSHRMRQDQGHAAAASSAIMLHAETNGMPNQMCVVGYHAWAPTIGGSCIVQPPATPADDGSFIVFISPPSASASAQQQSAFRRRIVFLLDHSGSMGGQPMLEAKEALLLALDQLLPFDEFNIVAFDDGISVFHQQGGLTGASFQAIQAAKHWVEAVRAEGATDILRAYQAASAMLAAAEGGVDTIPFPMPIIVQPGFQLQPQHQQQQPPFPPQPPHGHGHGHGQLPPGFSSADSNGGYPQPGYPVQPVFYAQQQQQRQQGVLPIIVLVTDGKVDNEMDVCDYARSQAKAYPDRRTYTFGIGPFCNKYFLKMLAVEGRGHSDVCLCNETIKSQMFSLMSKTAGPVLCNLSLHIQGLEGHVQLYPETLPDLTQGAPVIVAGKWSGTKGTFGMIGATPPPPFPSQIQVSGTDSYGNPVSFFVSATVTETAPVSQLVDKNRLDILVGKWWLASGSEKDAMRKLAVATSTNSGIPCPFTQSIAYENHDSSVHVVPFRPSPPGFVPGIAAPVNPHIASVDNNNNNKPSVVARNKSRPAMIGGAVVLGTALAAAVAFGSVAATASNIGIDGIAGLLNGMSIGGVPDFGGLSFPDVGGVDCGVCGCSLPTDVCGCNPAEFCGPCVGELNNACNALQGCAGGLDCGQLCSPVAQCLGGLGQCDFGAVLGSLGDCCSNAAGAIGPLCESVGPLFASAGQMLCQVIELCAACVPD